MVIHVTTAKFKPLIISISGFAFSSVANILIIVILGDLCLLPVAATTPHATRRLAAV
jgi:hypothetical protein